jgi:hypothetical protein
MNTKQEAAIARCCDHENLVGELVEALENFMEAVVLFDQAMVDGVNVQGAVSRFVGAKDNANHILAKAKEGAQP